MTNEVKKVTAKDVLSAIFARHSGPEWCRFAEVSQSTGAASGRRADAVCLNVWPSKGFAIHGFEIKVTRADFLHEMKDITKADAVGKFCDFWWLAAPKGIVSVDELPASWGLMELHANGLKINKQAPKRENPVEFTRGFTASLLRKSRDADDIYIQTRLTQEREAMKADLQRELIDRNKRVRARAEKDAEWIDKFEELFGERFLDWNTPEAAVERIRVAESLKFGNISRLMLACAGVVDEIGKLGKALPDGRYDHD